MVIRGTVRGHLVTVLLEFHEYRGRITLVTLLPYCVLAVAIGCLLNNNTAKAFVPTAVAVVRTW